MLFSATLNARVGNLAWEYMNNPGEVIIEPERVTVETVTQELYHVGKDEKMRLLLGLLKQTNPDNAVIFTNTRHSAWEVAKRLEVNGYAVTSLMGDLPQKKRLKIVDAVKKGHQKFLVATDVAARGLHIEELEMVINYDVPLEAESYVHRIGRTARAGKKGRTITMACEEYVYGLGPIEKLLGHKLPVSWADKSLFAQDRSAGMRFPPRERYREIGGDTRSGGTREKRKGPPRKHRGPGREQKNSRSAGKPYSIGGVFGRWRQTGGYLAPEEKRHPRFRQAFTSFAARAGVNQRRPPPPGRQGGRDAERSRLERLRSLLHPGLYPRTRRFLRPQTSTSGWNTTAENTEKTFVSAIRNLRNHPPAARIRRKKAYWDVCLGSEEP